MFSYTVVYFHINHISWCMPCVCPYVLSFKSLFLTDWTIIIFVFLHKRIKHIILKYRMVKRYHKGVVVTAWYHLPQRERFYVALMSPPTLKLLRSLCTFPDILHNFNQIRIFLREIFKIKVHNIKSRKSQCEWVSVKTVVNTTSCVHDGLHISPIHIVISTKRECHTSKFHGNLSIASRGYACGRTERRKW
jgi:hypothetical protein